MAPLTLEQLQKALKDQDGRLDKKFDAQEGKTQKMLDGFARDIKAFVKEQDDELARITNKGFEHIIKQLDVTQKVERHEKMLQKIMEALNIRV